MTFTKTTQGWKINLDHVMFIDLAGAKLTSGHRVQLLDPPKTFITYGHVLVNPKHLVAELSNMSHNRFDDVTNTVSIILSNSEQIEVQQIEVEGKERVAYLNAIR